VVEALLYKTVRTLIVEMFVMAVIKPRGNHIYSGHYGSDIVWTVLSLTAMAARVRQLRTRVDDKPAVYKRKWCQKWLVTFDQEYLLFRP
jgi:hypothetical protein